MKLLSKLLSKDVHEYGDNDIIALANATMIAAAEVSDAMFAEQMLGQTIAFVLEDKTIVAPCNGTLEVMYPTGHAFAIRMNNGMGILVHVGINTVNLQGNGFKVLAKQGDTVKAGQIILEVNLDLIKKSGYDSTTMMIVTEPLNENESVDYIDYGKVERGQIINK